MTLGFHRMMSVYRSMWTSALWIGDSDVVGVSCAAAVFTEDAWVRLSIPLFLIVSQSFFCFCLHLLLIFLHRDAIGMPATHGSSVRALSCVKKQTEPVVWPPLRGGSVHCYHPPLLSPPACGVGEGRCCPRLYRPTSCTFSTH